MRKMCTLRLVIFVVLLESYEFFVAGHGKGIRTRKLYPRNFVSVSHTGFREKQLRIGYNRVLSLETSASVGSSAATDVVYRQMTDGRRLVQGAYQGGVLKECDFNREYQPIHDFVTEFIPTKFVPFDQQFGSAYEAYNIANTTGNDTLAFEYFKHIDFLKQFNSDRVNINRFRKECRSFYKLAKRKARLEAKSMRRQKRRQGSEYRHLFEGPNTKGLTNKHSSSHSRTRRATEPEKKSRRRRAALDLNSVLIFPGTKWCGKGDLARCYDDLGEDQELDVCCRDHDCCPYIIPPFTSRFNIFNYRFHSLIHCDCDNRFRGCLRESPSSTANIIGRIYFNLLGSKCFEFEEKKVCTERSWWGRCQNYEKQETAVIKNQRSFLHEVVSKEADNTT